MTVKKKTHHYDGLLLGLFACIALLVSVCVIVILGRLFLLRNTEDRAKGDLQQIADYQSAIVSERLDNEYENLYEIQSLIEYGMNFGEEAHRAFFSSIVKSHKYCMLAVVDLDGNAVNYKGELMGNVSDRAYFADIISGRSDRVFQYLATPRSADSPRVVLSIPLEENGEITGVLFCSKEVDVIQEALLSDTAFEGRSSLTIVMENNEIVCKSSDPVGEDTAGDETDIIIRKDIGYGLTLVCRIGEKASLDAYAESRGQLQVLLVLVAVDFAIFFVLLVLISARFKKRNEAATLMLSRQHAAELQAIKELKCGIVEYDLKRNTVDSNDVFESLFDCHILHGDRSILNEIREEHPEFNYVHLEECVSLVRNKKETAAFDSFVTVQGNTMWVHVTLIPTVDVSDEVVGITAAVQDVTRQHADLEKTLNMLSRVHGGIHRCYLSDPIHIEYFSDGMLEMLGYTKQEFTDIIGRDSKFTRCILEEDREKYASFAAEMAKAETTKTIVYRLRKKDGEAITVSDTMESKRSAAGIMYGYSVLTDVTEYMTQNAQLESELEDAKQQLKEARLKISMSQMQPHFLYNALASIRELILIDPEYASQLVYDFTVHLRACIRSMTNDDLIPISKEIENIKAYVEIEQMRFGDKLKVEYDIADEDIMVIPLGVQPLVENSIRHGIYQRGARGGTVTVRSYEEHGNHIIEVSDDGVGFDFEEVRREVESGQRDSTGIFNIFYRYETVMNAHVEVSSVIGEGTTVKIVIPEVQDESNHC